jgi:hypothetical protein
MAIEDAATVRVGPSPRGWEITMPSRRERFACEKLEEARGVAYLYALRSRPCELIVQDAYHRVLERALITGC